MKTLFASKHVIMHEGLLVKCSLLSLIWCDDKVVMYMCLHNRYIVLVCVQKKGTKVVMDVEEG